MFGKVSVKITDKATRELNLKKMLEEMGRAATSPGPHIKAGILADSGAHRESDGLTVVNIAVFNEFGTDTIPERPFMRTSAEIIKPEFNKLCVFLLGRLIDGSLSVDNALDRLGLLAQKTIKKTIVDFDDPPNAPSTIYRKARKAGRKKINAAFNRSINYGYEVMALYDNPLIDTGQMKESVTYEKVKK